MAEPGLEQPAAPLAPPEWHQYIPDDVKADASLKPVIDRISERDLPSLVKSHIHAQKRLGSAISLPNGESKPEDLAKWRSDNLPKLYASGAIQGAPATPDAYEIKKPEKLVEGMTWPDEFVTEAKGILHKAGFTQDQVNVAMDLHMKALGGLAQQAQTLAVSKDEAAAALQKQWGANYEANVLIADKGAERIFGKHPERLEKFKASGALTDPDMIQTLHEIGALFMEGDPNIGGGQMGSNVEADYQEAFKTMTDPKHADYKRYHANDPVIVEKVQNAYKKKHGTQEVS